MTSPTFRPKYITFDCYGTLTRMRMGDMAREMFADRIPADRMEQFLADFSAYRFDECLGAWQPYDVLLKNSSDACAANGICSTSMPKRSCTTTGWPTWGPHPDVPAGLSKSPTRSRS